jgi:16S rRNA (adenine1518-N6/adenine1519-N6)-dimethyltransferase
MENKPFITKKSLGQHFLNSPAIPERLCAAGEVVAGEVVVEIGAGTGRLTKALLARGATMIAIETDPRAIAVLTGTFTSEINQKTLVISEQDARALDLSGLGLTDHGYKVVANIPYYLSGLLLRTFLEHPTLQPSTLVFLVQKEVAERIARDRKSSLLSLSVAVFGEPTYVMTVGRGHFSPPPKVDSAIIAVKNISRERLGDIPSAHFFKLLHLGFGQKRKQLLRNLASHYTRPFLETIFTHGHLPLDSRAEDLSLAQWLTLAEALPPTLPVD